MSAGKTPLRVLMVEDAMDDAELMTDHLEQAGFQVSCERVESAAEMTQALREKQWDVILSDFILPGFTGLDALQIAQQFELDTPFIIVSGSIGEDLAVQAMRAGAQDYLMKDRMARLGAAVQRELKESALRRERRRMRQENERQAEELRLRAEQLARSNAELERFAYLAAHDLQEPLRMVGAYSQLLVKRYHGKLDTDVDRIVDFIRTGIERMETLITGLLSYSATLHGEPLTLCPTDTGVIVDEAIAAQQQLIVRTGAAVTRDPLPPVLADGPKLRTVFEHLLANAIKFRKEEISPRVHIKAQTQTDDALFSVKDNGIGIDPQYAEQIFGLFKRLHRDDATGLGMGLALCRRIIEQHGGRIWVESSVGDGATFFFTLKPAPVPAQAVESGP
jgi:signal transduction histidine kinase